MYRLYVKIVCINNRVVLAQSLIAVPKVATKTLNQHIITTQRTLAQATNYRIHLRTWIPVLIGRLLSAISQENGCVSHVLLDAEAYSISKICSE